MSIDTANYKKLKNEYEKYRELSTLLLKASDRAIQLNERLINNIIETLLSEVQENISMRGFQLGMIKNLENK